MNRVVSFVVFGILFAGLTCPAFAQAGQEKAVLPTVTLDLRDAPIRAALEQIFNSAKLDYSIAPTVQGYVNLKITDQPFDNALKLILRSSTTPLTYSVTNGVCIVQPRTVSDTSRDVAPPPSTAETTRTTNNYEQIELTYVDPADLSRLLSIQIIPVGARRGQSRGGQGGFGAGGFGGGSGGFGGGGLGGSGGGFGGGGFGGGFGGGGGIGGGGFGGGGQGGFGGGSGFGGGGLGGGRGF